MVKSSFSKEGRVSISLKSFLPAHYFSWFGSDADKESGSQNSDKMAAIDLIRYSDGRVLYQCGTSPIPPTNPKAGSPASGNTIIWNGRTRVSSLIIPRQNPVNLDTWAPQSSSRTYSGPVTYSKPPFRQSVADSITARKNSVNSPCANKALPNRCNTKTANG